MRTKIIIGIIVAVVVVVVVVVASFLLGGIKPPVDTSGVNPHTTLETDELAPAELVGNNYHLNLTSTLEVTLIDGRIFYVDHTWAKYDGITIHIIKADYSWEASDTFEILYDDWYGSGSGSRTKTSDWFKCDIDGVHAFYWKSGVWVFGVEAGDSDTMTQAAEEFVEHLRTKS